MDKAITSAKKHIAAAQNRQKTFADQHRREQQFQVGDKVWLSTANLNMPTGISRKLTQKQIGPFPIIEKVTQGAYKLKLPRHMKIHPVINVSSLSLHKEDSRFEHQSVRPPPLEGYNDASVYRAECILAKKKEGRTFKYFVKYSGYPEEEGTWEPKSNISLDLIKEFEG